MKSPSLRCLAIALLLGLVAVPGSPEKKTPRSGLPEPDPMGGSIGVTIWGTSKYLSTKPAKAVFFVRLVDGQEAFDATDLIPSNYFNKGQVYLLNAEPGRYVAVAAHLPNADDSAEFTPSAEGVEFRIPLERTVHHSLFFSMAMISDTEVKVVPQEMAFMGDYLVSMSQRMKRSDAAQAHYYRLLLPGVAGKPVFVRHKRGQLAYRADLKTVSRDEVTERGFWTAAHDGIFQHDPRWQALAASHLACGVGASPELSCLTVDGYWCKRLCLHFALRP